MMGSHYYQLVAVDVDGTLLDSSHRLASGAREAVAALTKAGIRVVLASGRPRPGVLPLLEELGLGPMHIGAGGAYAFGPDGGLLFQNLVPAGLLRGIVELARRCQIDPALHTFDQILLEGSAEHEAIMIDYNGSGFLRRVPDILASANGNPCKLTLYGKPENLRRYHDEVRAQNLPVELTYSKEDFLELNSRGVSKGAAVRALAEQLGVPLERTAAIGDQANDLSMFQVAGLSVAMGNAPEAVQQAARWIAPSNDESGAAWAMWKLLNIE